MVFPQHFQCQRGSLMTGRAHPHYIHKENFFEITKAWIPLSQNTATDRRTVRQQTDKGTIQQKIKNALQHYR